MNNSIFISYAQNREDVIIATLLNTTKTGFYVDVGANDPVVDSVTKHFYDKGWTGINVEPIKKIHKLLVESRPKDTNVNMGISDKRGKLKLREYVKLDGHSTFSETTKKSKDVDQEFLEYDVEVITLKELFKKHDVKKIDFLKIDVEGLEDEVINGNDWSLYRPTVLCIESDHIHGNWTEKFRKWNYELVMHDGLNEYYLAKESGKLLDTFSDRLVKISHGSLKAHQYNELYEAKLLFKQQQLINSQLEQKIKEHRSLISIQEQKIKETSYLEKSYLDRIKLAIYSLTSGWINREK